MNAMQSSSELLKKVIHGLLASQPGQRVRESIYQEAAKVWRCWYSLQRYWSRPEKLQRCPVRLLPKMRYNLSCSKQDGTCVVWDAVGSCVVGLWPLAPLRTRVHPPARALAVELRASLEAVQLRVAPSCWGHAERLLIDCSWGGPLPLDMGLVIFMVINLLVLLKKEHFHCSVGACNCERKKIIPLFSCFHFTTCELTAIKLVEVKRVQRKIRKLLSMSDTVGLFVGRHFSWKWDFYSLWRTHQSN